MTLPEPGQRVHLRGGAYVVQDIQPTLSQTLPDGSRTPVSHHVRLASLQEDAFGESLEVIWELEPGAAVRETNELPQPTGFDRPDRLDAFLNAVRWGAVIQADHAHIQSPFRGGVTPEPYQLDPVVRAVSMPRANLLIADDVGLGKTIEAGLVIQELIIRAKARKILVVCPSSLQVQWQEQMRDKFGLDFQIADAAMLRDLRRKHGPRANPWSAYPRLITSIDYIKRPNPSRLLDDALPPSDGWRRAFDVLVLDEAHCAAPSSTGRYAVDSQRTRIVRKLSRCFEHKLFLTATPHNGDANSWTALLELLDDQRFARGVEPAPEQLQRVMIRRMKFQITNHLQQKRFHDRILQDLRVSYPPEERELHQLFSEYAAMRRQNTSDKSAQYAVEFTLKLLKKRLFSSPGSFWTSIRRHAERLEANAAASTPPKRVERGYRILKSYLGELDQEDYGMDDAADAATEEKLDLAGDYHPPLNPEEKDLLNAIKSGAKAMASRPDAKAELLLSWLSEHIRPDKKWSDERVIIFTEYRHTMAWLMEQLASRGFASRTQTIYGGMPRDQREAVKAAFQTHPSLSEVRILLATDAAGEGLDLQNHCRYLIHYEIPWNPNRLEQRNGRIDRHGQTRAPHIFHFTGARFDPNRDPHDLRPGDLEGDLEFLAIAAHKVQKIREDLGVVGPVIAGHIQQAMLGDRRSLNTTVAEQDAQARRKNLHFERDQRKRIQDLENQYHQTRNSLGLTPAAIENVVRTGLSLAGKPALTPARLHRTDQPVYHMPQLSGGWAECLTGLNHPHTGQARPITFDPQVASGHDDVVLIHLGHKLVQLSLRLLRAEVWRSGDGRKLHRVCARIVPDHCFPGAPRIHLAVHARLIIIGATHQRLHEELVIAGGFIENGQFRVAPKDQQLIDLLQHATEKQPAESLRQSLAELFPQHHKPLVRALQTRVNRRALKLTEKLQKQCRSDLDKVTTIFKELQSALHQKLVEPQPAQFELFEPEEADQLHADRAALSRRHKQLPEERSRELAAIEARYDGPQPKYFPVAITWLVPASQSQ